MAEMVPPAWVPVQYKFNPKLLQVEDTQRVDATGDKLVQAGFTLNKEQHDAMMKDVGGTFLAKPNFRFEDLMDRQSHINALLIMSRGDLQADNRAIGLEDDRCRPCKKGHGFWVNCAVWEGFFYDICGNCKTQDESVGCKHDVRHRRGEAETKIVRKPFVPQTSRSGRVTSRPDRLGMVEYDEKLVSKRELRE